MYDFIYDRYTRTHISNSHSDEDVETNVEYSGLVNKNDRLIPSNYKANKLVRTNCIVCSAHKERKASAYMCNTGKIMLHIGDCFQKYLTRTKYQALSLSNWN